LDLILYPFHVPPAEAFNFAAELEVAADLAIVQDAEAVHHGHRAAGVMRKISSLNPIKVW
jgi:hypothetical protein